MTNKERVNWKNTRLPGDIIMMNKLRYKILEVYHGKVKVQCLTGIYPLPFIVGINSIRSQKEQRRSIKCTQSTQTRS